MAHVLIVDDMPAIRELVAEVASEEGYTVACATDLCSARREIARQRPDLLFLDIVLPDGDGMAFWRESAPPGCGVVFLSGEATVDNTVDALRAGAVDYLRKPVSLKRLRNVLVNMLACESIAQPRAPHCYDKMIGASAAMLELRAFIDKVAPTLATVLLVGESGTGKEIAAEAIHLASPRFAQPFIAVNCGAISPNLIESELFGHKKGSFTGADREHEGYFERARGGTLFLDEITEMSMDLQVRLLRVLESGRFTPVGAHEEIHADVRIIAATNRNPDHAVGEGKLRPDLYHRLSVFPIELPPLRERDGDVQLLAQHFLDGFNADHHTHKRMSAGMTDTLRQYSWPGNIRELRNYIYRTYILSGQVLDGSLNPFESALTPAGEAEISLPVGIPLADANREIILETLRHAGGVKKRAARMLGISTKTLYNKLEEYGCSADAAAAAASGGNGKATASRSVAKADD